MGVLVIVEARVKAVIKVLFLVVIFATEVVRMIVSAVLTSAMLPALPIVARVVRIMGAEGSAKTAAKAVVINAVTLLAPTSAQPLQRGSLLVSTIILYIVLHFATAVPIIALGIAIRSALFKVVRQVVEVLAIGTTARKAQAVPAAGTAPADALELATILAPATATGAKGAK